MEERLYVWVASSILVIPDNGLTWCKKTMLLYFQSIIDLRQRMHFLPHLAIAFKYIAG